MPVRRVSLASILVSIVLIAGGVCYIWKMGARDVNSMERLPGMITGGVIALLGVFAFITGLAGIHHARERAIFRAVCQATGVGFVVLAVIVTRMAMVNYVGSRTDIWLLIFAVLMLISSLPFFYYGFARQKRNRNRRRRYPTSSG